MLNIHKHSKFVQKKIFLLHFFMTHVNGTVVRDSVRIESTRFSWFVQIPFDPYPTDILLSRLNPELYRRRNVRYQPLQLGRFHGERVGVICASWVKVSARFSESGLVRSSVDRRMVAKACRRRQYESCPNVRSMLQQRVSGTIGSNSTDRNGPIRDEGGPAACLYKGCRADFRDRLLNFIQVVVVN